MWHWKYSSTYASFNAGMEVVEMLRGEVTKCKSLSGVTKLHTIQTVQKQLGCGLLELETAHIIRKNNLAVAYLKALLTAQLLPEIYMESL